MPTIHKPAAERPRPKMHWAAWLKDFGKYSLAPLLLVMLVAASGCQTSARAAQASPTRTPKPTFTPTRDAPTPALAVEVAPSPTPEPTATFTPAPTVASQAEAPAAPAPSPTPVPTATPTPTPTPPSPAAERVPKTGRAILIDQDQQQMYIFEDGVVVRAIPCSTGDPKKHRTKEWEGTVGDYIGTFFSFGAYADHAWYLFRDYGSILIHGAPYILGEDGEKIYQEIETLGRYPNSHGCIRIHPDEALWFTFWNPRGVPIIITPWTGGEPLNAATNH